MVCIYCGSSTRVTNSRAQKRLLQVWRRRTCSKCGAIFTTNEAADLSTSLSVRYTNGARSPFSRDRLFLSILKAVGHRQQPITDAGALTGTIMARLVQSTGSAAINPAHIVEAALEALQHFDSAAAVQYRAYHPSKNERPATS